VNVRQVTSDVFYGDQYLKWTFAQDYWGYSPYLSQVAQGSLPDSPYNETHWTNEEFNKLHEQAQATVDEAKRTEILHAMQKLEFEQGGYLIAAYNQNVDLMGSYVEGLMPAATGLSMGNSDFKAIWLA
jgi:peptide/nickel transport system substrate-binding protein